MTKVRTRAWKTIKVLRIDGTPFALQQQVALYEMNGRNGKAFEQFPEDQHRMVSLMDLIDNDEEAVTEILK